MKTLIELEQMTTREIAGDACLILNTKGYDTAKVELVNHITVINKKMAEFGAKLNKEMGLRKTAPKVWRVTDFLRFK